MMVALLLLTTLSIVTGMFITRTIRYKNIMNDVGNPLPPACSQHLASPPGGESLNCHYGQTRDTCGNVVCMKGPGEMCGGKYGR